MNNEEFEPEYDYEDPRLCTECGDNEVSDNMDICEDCDKARQKTYECPRCGFKQTFDVAYMDSGRYCPNCDYETNIPLHYWR